MDKKFEISTYVFDGRDVSTTTKIGIYSEAEKNLFVSKLLELGYKEEKEADNPCKDCDEYDEEVCVECGHWRDTMYEKKNYGIRLPEPSYDHHGDYYVTYSVNEVIPHDSIPINEAIDQIVDPKKWDIEECEGFLWEESDEEE